MSRGVYQPLRVLLMRVQLVPGRIVRMAAINDADFRGSAR
jgi:hypothetical protein